MTPELFMQLVQMYRQQSQQKRDHYKQYSTPQQLPQSLQRGQSLSALPKNNPFRRLGGI